MNGVAIAVVTVLSVAALAAAVALALTPAVLSIVRRLRRRKQYRSSPELQAEARVVDKRAHITGGSRDAEQRYYVTFQFATGSRLELEVPPSEAGMLVVGDEGRLDWRGGRYLGFAREILR